MSKLLRGRGRFGRKRERVLLERRQKEEENKLLNRYVESECFVVAAAVVFLYCRCNQFNLLKRVVHVS